MVTDNNLTALAAEWGRIQTQEILLVVCGLKPACRLRVRRERLHELAAVAKQYSLQLVVGYDAIVGRWVPGRGGFSEWCRRVPASPHGSADCYAYLSTSHIQAQRLRRSDEAQDDSVVGELLGYPLCCINLFCNKDRHNSERIDPVFSAYADYLPISWYLNASLICFDYGLLTHVPCSSECQNSLSLSYRYFEFLFNQSPEYASAVSRMLSTFVIHTKEWGVAAFTATFREVGLEVGDILAIYADSMIGKFMRKSSIIKREEDSVVIDGLILSGNQAKLFQYC